MIAAPQLAGAARPAGWARAPGGALSDPNDAAGSFSHWEATAWTNRGSWDPSSGHPQMGVPAIVYRSIMGVPNHPFSQVDRRVSRSISAT